MATLGGLASLAAFFLLLAGVVKAIRPRVAAGVLVHAGLPSGSALVRLVGGAEIVIAVWCLVAGSHAWALAGAAYAGFTAFLGYLMARGLADKGCGCLGGSDREEQKVGWLHVGFDLGAVAVLTGAWLAQAPPVTRLPEATAWESAGLALCLGVLGYLIYLSVRFLPAVGRARTKTRGARPMRGLQQTVGFGRAE